jgi:hypothetical protein
MRCLICSRDSVAAACTAALALSTSACNASSCAEKSIIPPDLRDGAG